MKVILSCLIAFASTVLSPISYGSDELGAYIGAKIGYAKFSGDLDFEGAEISARDDTGYGLYGGYKLNSSFAIEFEYNDIETDTEEVNYFDKESCPSGCIIRGDIEVNTYALYGVYRTAGKIYFKGRAGYLYEESELTFSGNSYDKKHDNGVAASIGGGIGFGSVKIEAEYNYLDSSTNFFSLGAHYEF